jgi:hypothetical protein
LFLVLRGTPAAVDVELDPVAGSIRCGLAEGTEESSIKVGHGRIPVIEDRRADGDGTVSLAKHTTVLAAKDGGTVTFARRTTVLTAKTAVLTARNVDG